MRFNLFASWLTTSRSEKSVFHQVTDFLKGESQLFHPSDVSHGLHLSQGVVAVSCSLVYKVRFQQPQLLVVPQCLYSDSTEQ